MHPSAPRPGADTASTMEMAAASAQPYRRRPTTRRREARATTRSRSARLAGDTARWSRRTRATARSPQPQVRPHTCLSSRSTARTRRAIAAACGNAPLASLTSHYAGGRRWLMVALG
jgi:hypothetical protein